MAAKSVFRRAIDDLDRQIRELTIAKDILIRTRTGAEDAKANTPKRTRRSKVVASAAPLVGDTGE